MNEQQDSVKITLSPEMEKAVAEAISNATKPTIKSDEPIHTLGVFGLIACCNDADVKL